MSGLKDGLNLLWNGDLSKLKDVNKEIFTLGSSDDRHQGNMDRWLTDLNDIDKAVQSGIMSWQDYSNSLNKNEQWIAKWGQETQGQIRTQEDFVEANKKARQSVIDYNKSLESNGLKGKLKNFGMDALSMAGNMLTGMAVGFVLDKAISGAIKLWDDYAHAQENSIERGDKALSNLKASQQKIASAQSVLDDLKSNTITLSDGSEITRFEQLSQGVNSLGQNISLTKDEFAEYNSMLDQMSNAGLNATNSMANLESQVKQLRTSANYETLEGLGDWVDSFNAKNNQMATDFTKEIGYQQKINALNKIYADPTLKNDSPEKVSKTGWWESLKNTMASAQEIEKASQLVGKESSKYIESANKMYQDNIDAVTDTKALLEIAEQFSIDLIDAQGNFDYKKYSSNKVQKQLEDALKSLQSSVESEVQQSAGFLKAIFENNKNFESLSEDAAEMFTGIFDNIDYDTISKYMMDNNGMLNQQLMKDWVNQIADKASNSEIQEQLEKLFSLDTKKSNLSFSEYKKQANDLINSISSSIPELSSSLLKKTSGFDDTLEELQTSYNKIVKQFGVNNANKLNNGEIELAAKIIGVDEFSGTFKDLLNQIHLVKSEMDIDATPLYDEIGKAFESENSGDIYKDMVSKLESAKELFDKGEIGTDDFKSVAKWLSPSGADDAMNFQENWKKAKRYFTDDSAKGVQNFLKDLKAKDLAESTKAVDANGNAIEQWSYKISDLEEAAQKLGIGFEPMMAMFGRLEDYGFSNNFVGSLEQGKSRISDKAKELAEAEAHLAELTKPGQYKTDEGKTFGNQTAIDAQRDKIAQLKQDIIETTDAMKQLAEHSAKDYEAQAEGAKSAIQTLADERQKVLNDKNMDASTRESVAGMMEDQIRAWANEYHIELDADLKPVNKEEVQNDINSEPITLDIDYSNLDGLKSEARDALSTVQDLVNETSSPIQLNLDSSNLRNIDDQISMVSSVLKDLRNEDGIVDISTPGAQEAINVLNALYAQKNQLTGKILMSVDTSQLDSDVSTVISKLQEFHNAYTELQNLNTLQSAGVNVDTSDAESKLSNITSELQNLSGKQAEILATIVPDTSSVQSIQSSIAALNPEILVKVGVDTSAIEDYNSDDKEAKVKYDVDDSLIESYSPPNKDAKVLYTADLSGLPNTLTPITRTVQYVASGIAATASAIVSSSTSKKAKASGTFHAHASGTAYNVLNMIPAFANGTKVSLPQDEEALVNEIGNEAIIRNGKVYEISGGTQIASLKRGDIVINANQWAQIKKYGSTNTFAGKAYADGTVGNIRNLVATSLDSYAGGSGGGSFGYGSSGKKSGTSSSSKKSSNNKSTNKNTAAVNKNTAATNSNTSAVEDTKDWIAVRLDRLAHSLDESTNLASDYYSGYIKQNEQLNKAISQTKTNINENSAAYWHYMNKADSIGLSSDYKSRIQSGQFNIETITDENLKDKVEKYQEWLTSSHLMW